MARSRARAMRVADHGHEQVVGHEVAALEVGLGRLAQGRSLGQRLAQHVAGGDAGHPEALGQTGGLRALPRPRGAEEDDGRLVCGDAAWG